MPRGTSPATTPRRAPLETRSADQTLPRRRSQSGPVIRRAGRKSATWPGAERACAARTEADSRRAPLARRAGAGCRTCRAEERPLGRGRLVAAGKPEEEPLEVVAGFEADRPDPGFAQDSVHLGGAVGRDPD